MCSFQISKSSIPSDKLSCRDGLESVFTQLERAAHIITARNKVIFFTFLSPTIRYTFRNFIRLSTAKTSTTVAFRLFFGVPDPLNAVPHAQIKTERSQSHGSYATCILIGIQIYPVISISFVADLRLNTFSCKARGGNFCQSLQNCPNHSIKPSDTAFLVYFGRVSSDGHLMQRSKSDQNMIICKKSLP